jgi:hypothetical protein
MPRSLPFPRYSISNLTVAATLVGAIVLPTTALAEQIECPLEEIRREVTTPLPSGWWHTPQVSSLRETRVMTIGGRTALQCDYGLSGNIQRYAPEGATCEALADGFDCVLDEPVPQTHSTGPIELGQTYAADLDTGGVGGDGTDIWFQAETSDLLYISPQNRAELSVGDRSSRGYGGCATARYSRERVSLRDIPVGSYVCVKTDQGRISQFRVNAISTGSPKVISLGYTTWR